MNNSTKSIASPEYKLRKKIETSPYVSVMRSPSMKSKADNNRKTIAEICDEYELMRNFFDPMEHSPNLFMKKLDNRFRMYFRKCKNKHSSDEDDE